MAVERAIDKLRKAFRVDARSSYAIKSGDELVLKLYWTPLTIADRDRINNIIGSLKLQETDNSLDFAIQMVIEKAEDEDGKKLFQSGDWIVTGKHIRQSGDEDNDNQTPNTK